MSGKPRSYRKEFWLVTGLFLLVAVGLLAMVVIVGIGTKFFSPPDQVRPWAEAGYDAAIDPSTAPSIPTLKTLPAPVLTIDSPVIDGEIDPKLPPGARAKMVILSEGPAISQTKDYYEVFPADPSGTVTLPDGNRLKLTAVALTLPGDVEWGDKEYAKARPKWVDPRTGKPLSGPEHKSWQKEQSVPRKNPRLYLRVEKAGNAPLRWQWPEIYDSRGKLRLNSSASWSSEVEHGMFWIDLETWHQAPTKVTVHFAFGDPVSERISLKKCAVVTFGDDASLSLLEILPHGHSSSSSGGSSDRKIRFTFDANTKPQKVPQCSFLFQIWPPINHFLIDYRVLPHGEGYPIFSGGEGISAVELYRKESEATELQLRRFPRLGRAVFDLESLPRLPEVENLFEVPIPLTRIEYESQFLRSALRAAGVSEQFTQGHGELPDSMFPLTLTDTTPAAMLAEYERLTGKRLYFDRDALRVTDEAPMGLMEKWKEWWRRKKPSWLPW